MAFRRYTVANGQMIAQQLTDGTRVGFQRDALGSVVGIVTLAGAVQKTYRYKPYGTTLATTGTGTDPEYLWNGVNQYRTGPRPPWSCGISTSLGLFPCSTGAFSWRPRDPASVTTPLEIVAPCG